jgi:hypothetical protein
LNAIALNTWLTGLDQYSNNIYLWFQAKPSQAKPSQAKPSQAKPSQAKPSQAKPSQAKPSQAKPSQDKPSQAKPIQAKPSQAKPSQAKPSQAKPSQAKPSQAKPSQAKPSHVLLFSPHACMPGIYLNICIYDATDNERKRKMSESESYIETSIKVIAFSGKKKDLIKWEEKFISKSKCCRYKEILLGMLEVAKSTNSFDPAIDKDKIKISLGEKNVQRYTLIWSYWWI